MFFVIILLAFCNGATAEEFWGPSTSGPFFTSTAEASRLGAFTIEPWFYELVSPGQMPLNQVYNSFNAGLGSDFNADFNVPYVWGQGNNGLGTGMASLKKTFIRDANTTKFLARPAVAVSFREFFPLGAYGSNVWSSSLQLIFRKRFKPFILYGQIGNSVVNFNQLTSGYIYNYSMAFEHVLNDKHGLGYLLEVFGQTTLTSRGFNYLWVAPTVEFNPITEKTFSMNVGLGLALPVYQYNYPEVFTPMVTFTFCFNNPAGQQP